MFKQMRTWLGQVGSDLRESTDASLLAGLRLLGLLYGRIDRSLPIDQALKKAGDQPEALTWELFRDTLIEQADADPIRWTVTNPKQETLTITLHEVHSDTAHELGVAVVRRRSGGGAVLLDPGGVVWVDVVVPRHDPRWDDDVVNNRIPFGLPRIDLAMALGTLFTIA